MERLRKISVLLILVATLHFAAAHMDPRTALHIPEKIIGGVIDIVHSHKNKPVPGQANQYPNQNYQYPQYQQWNQQGNQQGNQQANYQGQAQYQGQYQGQQAQLQGQLQGQQQGQLQGQMQGQNQGQYYPSSYPQNAPVPVYPQPTYPANTAQYPVQNGASQSQAQGQYQYPQNAGQYQGQNQQANGQYQGQNQQANGQYQGQMQQTGFQTPQSQYPSQAGQFQGQNQATGQYTGQEMNSGQFQGMQGGSNGQVSGFQMTGGHTGSQGPACVCQAWTKPNTPKGDTAPATLEKTDNTIHTEV